MTATRTKREEHQVDIALLPTVVSRALVLVAHTSRQDRTGLASQLGADPDLEVAGEAATADEALAAARREAPDVLVADARLPGLAALIEAVRVELPATRVVVVSDKDAALLGEHVRRGATSTHVAAGAGSASRSLVWVVRRAARDENDLTAATAAALMMGVADTGGGLTPRERAVLEGFAVGTNADVLAHAAGLTRGEVHRIAGNAVVKCQAASRQRTRP